MIYLINLLELLKKFQEFLLGRLQKLITIPSKYFGFIRVIRSANRFQQLQSVYHTFSTARFVVPRLHSIVCSAREIYAADKFHFPNNEKKKIIF